MKKNKYLKALLDLERKFNDEESLNAINLLRSKLNDLSEDEDKSSNEEFPIPVELNQHVNSYAIFSDGACRGNPGPGAWAVFTQSKMGEKLFESVGVEFLTTNNKMELEAAIMGITELRNHLSATNLSASDDDVFVYLYSDSKYVVDGIEKWVPGWKNNNWRKADNKAPENIELWKRFDEEKAAFKNLKFMWVKGHAGHPQNEYCDQLANRALDEAGL